MLTKLLIFATVIFFVYIFFFKNKRKEEIQEGKKKSKKIEGDTMVECAKCSTFVSDKESIIKDGQFFCSKECARLV